MVRSSSRVRHQVGSRPGLIERVVEIAVGCEEIFDDLLALCRNYVAHTGWGVRYSLAQLPERRRRRGIIRILQRRTTDIRMPLQLIWSGSNVTALNGFDGAPSIISRR
jgi:hypothetical protein